MADITAVDLGQALAEHGVEVMDGGRSVIGFLANPERVAHRALETLAERQAAPGARIDADLCASCGNQFPPGQVCNGCHAQPIEDPELIAAQQILDALAPLEVYDPAAVLRVLRWARERYDL